MILEQPVLFYAGTSGWSGSDTSRERAMSNDAVGRTHKLQQNVLDLLDEVAEKGATWKEVSDKFNVHHGSASGVLSVLHKAGLIARLFERRERCAIYVGLNYVNGRQLAESKKKKVCEHDDLKQQIIERLEKLRVTETDFVAFNMNEMLRDCITTVRSV